MAPGTGSPKPVVVLEKVSKKRLARELETDDVASGPSKRIHPFFSKQQLPEAEAVGRNDGDDGPFHWKRPPFLPSSCLFAENLRPEIRSKISAFDLDGTVVKFSPSSNEEQFVLWHKDVLRFLKEAYDAGNTVVFFSNQLYPEKVLVRWRRKIQCLAKKLHDVPFFLFAATARDGYRKPMPGMWIALEKLATEAGVTIDRENSFFVGDAAGRKRDHAGTDRKFANNVGIKFYTPEEYFLKNPAEPYELKGIQVNNLVMNEGQQTTTFLLSNTFCSSSPAGPRVTPTSSPILPMNRKKPEIVLFVGCPASGKTTFFENTFQPAGYTHVNQDKLGSRPKCVKTAKESLEKDVSCVIDNTNRDKKTRQFYVALAEGLGVPIRCFVFKISPELAWHNNLYRTYCLPLISPETASKTKLIPYSAIMSFSKDYEEPSIEEGFTEVKTVNWQFEGDADRERYWRMWLQIDGK